MYMPICDVRHMLLVGLHSIHDFSSRYSIRRAFNNWSIGYTKQVAFGGLALLDVSFSRNR